ncbi:MAG TPA: hypothetical protein VFE46_01410 [Pirellulales bacterium]|jgi:DNA repair exonuclease SbcCD nuclease subunit|nr:hypothetical protein [Pirellulales bacterium]
MPQRPFRFLHAADLHLSRPCQAAGELPEHLVDLLIDAPLRAAEKVFDAAINQHVDFVLLAGNVIDPRCSSPRELLFIVEQFQRLASHNIVVYWSGGLIDSIDDWPEYVSWPSNVRRFPQNRTQRYRHEITEAPLCEIIGCGHDDNEPSRPYQFAPSNSELFSIAVTHASWNSSALGEMNVNYWALGGQQQRSTPLQAGSVAHFSGSPQGRNRNETGPHGCTMVAVDEQRRVQLSPVACDVLRWMTPQLSVLESSNRQELESLLHDRTEQLLAASPDVPLFVTWRVACHDPWRSKLQDGSLALELVSKLREEFGNRPVAPVWTLAIEPVPPDRLPAEWIAEETLRGDFLRAAQQCLPTLSDLQPIDAAIEPTLTTANTLGQPSVPPLVLSLPDGAAEWAALGGISPAGIEAIQSVQADDPESNRQALREVVWLGADLLCPAEPKR